MRHRTAAPDSLQTNPARPFELDIPDWLHTGVEKKGSQVMTVAHHAYRLSSVNIDMPVLIVPLSGTKRLELGAYCSEGGPGKFLMVHQATHLQMENIPLDGNAYRAWVIGFPWHVVELARALLRAHVSLTEHHGAAPFTEGALRPVLPALQHLLLLLTAPEMPDGAAVDHGLLGVMLALVRHGHGQFLHASDPSLSARIRLLVMAEPARAWNSADFEERLHMSGATLRRRLAEEHTSLRILLREARLHHGLALLQTTRKPVKSVALACGYRSAPSFTRNFIEHFGVEPSAVANV